MLIKESDLVISVVNFESLMDVSPRFCQDITKREISKLELLEAANPRLPHLLSWTPLVNTRRRTPPCSPGRSETDYLLKESVVKKMFLACPASIGKY